MNKQKILENEVKKIVNETIREVRKIKLMEDIKTKALSILMEDDNFNQTINKRRHDDKENAAKKKSKKSFVLQKLNGNEIKQSEAMRYLWGGEKGSKEDDINRSLFSKMVTGEPDNDGVVRHFNDNEITKLAQYIHDLGS